MADDHGPQRETAPPPPPPPPDRATESFEKARRGSAQVAGDAVEFLPPGGLTDVPQALIGTPSANAEASAPTPPAADGESSE
jgi:hypothetical protein